MTRACEEYVRQVQVAEWSSGRIGADYEGPWKTVGPKVQRAATVPFPPQQPQTGASYGTSANIFEPLMTPAGRKMLPGRGAPAAARLRAREVYFVSARFF